MRLKYYPGPITNDQLPLIANIAERLDHAFDWEHTPQGFAYWEAVHDALISLSMGSAQGKEGGQ